MIEPRRPALGAARRRPIGTRSACQSTTPRRPGAGRPQMPLPRVPRAACTTLRAMSALPRRRDPLRALASPSGLAVLAITAFAALLSVQAADGPWLAELGRTIASRG